MISRPTATAPRPRRRTASGEAGFTLAELLVTVLLVSLVLLAVLALFDMTSRTARTQTHLAEMQQSLRVAQQTVVRAVRMAGRGGLPVRDDLNAATALPRGIAVAIANNVAAGTQIGGNASAPVLAGTDVITVRGVFDSPIYQFNPAGGPAVFNFNPNDPNATTGTLTVAPTTPTGAPQPLAALAEAVQRVESPGGSGTHPEALLLVSPLGDWAVVEMIPGGSVDTSGGDVTGVTVKFQARQGDFSGAYQGISRGGVFPTALETVAYAGILEEYQFYVREVRAVPGDAMSDLMPELVRARLYPNTNVPYRRDAASLTEVIADNVLDLQAALGIDRDGDTLIDENLAAGTDPATDEWLFNAAGDDPLQAGWNDPDASPLYYLRINTLVRTDRAEAYYTDDALTRIEDKDYTQAPYHLQNAEWERRYHRRQLRTTIDLRNL